jgi:hypothetical protein
MDPMRNLAAAVLHQAVADSRSHRLGAGRGEELYEFFLGTWCQLLCDFPGFDRGYFLRKSGL